MSKSMEGDGMSESKPFTAQSFQGFLEEQKLMGSRCKRCSAQQLPPRATCPKCGSREVEWVSLIPVGTVAARTMIHAGPVAMAAKCTYTMGIVKLEAGPKITAFIEGGPDVNVGTKVSGEFRKEGAKTQLVFKSVSATSP